MCGLVNTRSVFFFILIHFEFFHPPIQTIAHSNLVATKRSGLNPGYDAILFEEHLVHQVHLLPYLPQQMLQLLILRYGIYSMKVQARCSVTSP